MGAAQQFGNAIEIYYQLVFKTSHYTSIYRQFYESWSELKSSIREDPTAQACAGGTS